MVSWTRSARRSRSGSSPVRQSVFHRDDLSRSERALGVGQRAYECRPLVQPAGCAPRVTCWLGLADGRQGRRGD